MALEKSGVRLVVEDQLQAEKALKRFQSYIDSISTTKAQNQLTNLERTFNGLGSKSSNLQIGRVFKNLKSEVGSTVQNIGKAVPGFGKLSTVLGATEAQSLQLATALGTTGIALGAITAGAIGAAAAFGGFLALGKRGIGIEITAKAFGNSVAAFGDSTEILQKLRTQTRGTVSDFELMRLSVASLQGTSNAFRKEVAPSLGTIIDATNRIGAATGQSAEVIREKFLTGLRLMSKRRVDDTGAMIDLAVANQKYADAIGKEVSALTELDKQAAFAKEAIFQLDKISKEAGSNNFADILARSGAMLKNTFDKLSVAILPAFKPILGQFNVFLDYFEMLSSYAFPVLKTLAEIVGTTITGAFDIAGSTISAFFGGMGNGAGKVLPYAVALFQIFGDVVKSVIKGVVNTTQSAIRNFASLAGFFLKPLGQIGEFISRLFKGSNDQFNNAFEQLAFNVGRGGANIVGAFAAGLLRGGTKVAEAAGKIAQIVADFLVGFSPPKKGALANIDQGAANIAKAFADGFVGGILPPMEQVAADIDNRLGVIGTFSLDKVKAAFGRLDLAIRPFSEQLQLAKADLEAIAGFIDPALKIAERQRKNLLKAFGRGESVDINSIRFQDDQIQRLKELKDVETDRVDQAELQLGLVSAAQASERALLAIQQARLGTTEDIAAETEKAGKEAKEAKAAIEKAGGGGGGETPSEQGTGDPFTPGAAPDLLENSAVDNAKKQILAFGAGIAGAASQGINQGLAESGFNSALAQFQGATGNVKSQLARAASANPAQKILDKFSGLKDGIATTLAPFQAEFDRVFGALFGEGGSISGFVNRFTTLLSTAITAEGSPFMLAKQAISNIGTEINNALASVNFTPFKAQVNTTFSLDSEDSPFAKIGTALSEVGKLFGDFNTVVSEVFSDIFGEKGIAITSFTAFNDTMIAVFGSLFNEGGQVDIWLGQFLMFTNNVIDAIVEKFNLLTGDGEGSIKGALTTLGAVLRSAALVPLVNVGNDMIAAVESAINTIVGDFNKLPLPDINWSANFGRIEVPGAATGALGISGTFMAGEKGKELITTKRPVNVFPAAATRALEAMAAAPMPVYSGYGGNSYNTSSTMNQNNTINVNSPDQALLMERQLRARMR